MYCICCGEKLEDGTKFCPNCGMPVKEAFEKPAPKSPVVLTARFPENKTKPASEEAKPEQRRAAPAAAAAAPAPAPAPVGENGTVVLKIMGVLAIVSAVFLLIYAVDYSWINSWINFIAAVVLVVACFSQKRPYTVLMAIPLTIIQIPILINLITSIGYFRYYTLIYFIRQIVSFALRIAAVVLFWLLAGGVFKKKTAPAIVCLILLGLMALGIVPSAFSGMRDMIVYGNTYYFTAYLTSFGVLLFYVIYCIIVFYGLMKEPHGQNRQQTASVQGAQPRSSVPPVGLTCPRCGAALPVDSRFCEICGLPLSGTAPAAAAPAKADAPAGPSPLVCPKCGRELVEGSIFCSFCGASLAAPVPSEEEKPTADAAPPAEPADVPAEPAAPGN